MKLKNTVLTLEKITKIDRTNLDILQKCDFHPVNLIIWKLVSYEIFCPRAPTELILCQNEANSLSFDLTKHHKNNGIFSDILQKSDFDPLSYIIWKLILTRSSAPDLVESLYFVKMCQGRHVFDLQKCHKDPKMISWHLVKSMILT